MFCLTIIHWHLGWGNNLNARLAQGHLYFRVRQGAFDSLDNPHLMLLIFQFLIIVISLLHAFISGDYNDRLLLTNKMIYLTL